MSKIFITGGAGYVGAVLTPYLISKGHNITVYDLMIYGEDVLKKHKQLTIKGDIRDKKMLEKSIGGHDIVIHLACISNDPSFELNPKLGKEINLDCFEPLINEAISSGIKKFIYASSSSVYGVKDTKNVTEEMKLEPLTDYSKFKAECENILLSKSNDNFICTVLRPATVCGYSPRQRLDLVVNILTNFAYHKKEISVFGGATRPNIHILDMARAYEFLINAPKNKVEKEIFNAGYENQTVNKLASIVKVIGENVSIKKYIQMTIDHIIYHQKN